MVFWWRMVRTDEEAFLVRASRGLDVVVEGLREDVSCIRLSARTFLDRGDVFRVQEMDGRESIALFMVNDNGLDSLNPYYSLPFSVPAIVDISMRFQFVQPLARTDTSTWTPLDSVVESELDRSVWTTLSGNRVKLVDSLRVKKRLEEALVMAPVDGVKWMLVERTTGQLLYDSDHTDSFSIAPEGAFVRPVFNWDNHLAAIDLLVWYPTLRAAFVRSNLRWLLMATGIVLCAVLLLHLVMRNLLERTRIMMARNDLLTNMTHELNTPLANIGMAVETLRRGDAGQDQLAPAMLVDIIKRESDKLAGTVRKVLDVSLLESDELPLNKEYHELTEIVAQAVESFRPAFEARGASLRFEGSGQDHWVNADRTYLEQVLQIVLDNAMKYGGPNVEVSLKEKGPQMAELRVADDGLGLEMDEIVGVFSKFKRGRRSDPYAVQGTGIGLYHARLVVQAHGGRISIVPRKPQGMVVLIEIPQFQHGTNPDR